MNDNAMTNNRQFAVGLMNRANLEFDAPDLTLASHVIAQHEAEIADWLEAEMQGVVPVGDVVAKLRSGAWRQSKG